ncbi:MAG: class I SAM-dependent methyltransferase [Candidatus Omnitrophota bacterium]
MKRDCERFAAVKEHFNSEAGEFDSIITDRVPFYGLFIGALVNVLPFRKDEAIRVADLGCGTGAVARRVKERFPEAEITCVDFSPEMLSSARKELIGYTKILYHAGDVREFEFKDYHAVLSSLCLHHIGSKKEKRNFFRKVREGLLLGGVFYIYDVITASSNILQDVYLREWKRSMSEKLSPPDVEETLHKYREEDRPFALMDELRWLEEAGFKDVDVICKFYNGAVYGGVKRD